LWCHLCALYTAKSQTKIYIQQKAKGRSLLPLLLLLINEDKAKTKLIIKAPRIPKNRFCLVDSFFFSTSLLLSFFFFLHIEKIKIKMATESVILVTGGSGLVGQAVKWVIENDTSERYGKKENEKWIFLTSKDGDLR
jgi:hypothetical protein